MDSLNFLTSIGLSEDYVILRHLYVGLLWSFLFSLPVGMINLTVLSTTVSRGTYKGIWFAIGASLVEMVQALLALVLLDFFSQITGLTYYLKILSIPIFLILGITHWRKRPITVTPGVKSSLRRNTFLHGMAISGLNMLAYPFWILWGTIWMSEGVLKNDLPHISLFSVAVGAGTFAALFLYVLLSRLLIKRLSVINNWANKIIAIVFFILVGVLVYSLF